MVRREQLICRLDDSWLGVVCVGLTVPGLVRDYLLDVVGRLVLDLVHEEVICCVIGSYCISS